MNMKKVHVFKPYVSTSERAEVANIIKYGIDANGIEDEQYQTLDESMRSYFKEQFEFQEDLF